MSLASLRAKVARLEKEVHRVEAENRRLQAENRQLQDHFVNSMSSVRGPRYVYFEDHDAPLLDDMQRLRRDLAEARDEAAEQKQLAEQYRNENRRLARQLNRCEDEVSEQEAERKKEKGKGKDKGKEKEKKLDLCKLEKDLQSLANATHEFALEFGRDVEFSEPQNIGPTYLPLPDSSTEPAERMHCAAIEIAIGYALLIYVFEADACPTSKAKVAEMADRVVADVEDTLRYWMDERIEARWEAGLRALTRQAITCWRPFAQVDGLYATLDHNPGSWRAAEDMQGFYGSRDCPPIDGDAARPARVVPLFPQVFLRRCAWEERQLIFHGSALWTDQRAYVLAMEEMETNGDGLGRLRTQSPLPRMARPQRRRSYAEWVTVPSRSQSRSRSRTRVSAMRGRRRSCCRSDVQFGSQRRARKY